jgi:hypothetical protein
MEPNTSAEFSDDFNNFDDFLAESSFIAAENVSDLVLPSNSQASIGISSSRAFSSLGQYPQWEQFDLFTSDPSGIEAQEPWANEQPSLEAVGNSTRVGDFNVSQEALYCQMNISSDACEQPVEFGQDHLSLHNGSTYPVILRGLPHNTTEAHLRSLLAWSDEYVNGEFLAPGKDSCSALLYFSTIHGAERAVNLLHGRQNINKDAVMEVDIFQTRALDQNPAPVDKSILTKRHKFTLQDTTYLEKQFSIDSYPSADERAHFASQLGVSEKRIQTWFNNARQRALPSPCPKPTPLYRKNLKEISLARSSSKSPIERFAAIPPGSEGEPSIEMIEAAIKERLEMGKYEGTTSAANSAFDGSYVQDETIFRSKRYNSRSLHSAGGDFRISKSRSSAVSSSSNASHRFTRKSNLGKRRFPAMQSSLAGAKSESPKDNAEGLMIHVTIEFPCSGCHTFFSLNLEIQKLLHSLFCPNCAKGIRLLWTTDPVDASLAILMPSVIFLACENCHHESKFELESTSSLADILERSPTGRLDIPYDHECCRVKAFTITLQKGPRYHCTFCLVPFQSKYAWERHEESAHEPRVAWICCRTTTYDNFLALSTNKCIFCDETQPSTKHIAQAHKWNECKEQPLHQRVFFRKDQLAQHIRSFHKSSLSSHMNDNWKYQIDQKGRTWQCGICGVRFDEWKIRKKHISDHWEAGLDMKSSTNDWRQYGHAEEQQSTFTIEDHDMHDSTSQPEISTPRIGIFGEFPSPPFHSSTASIPTSLYPETFATNSSMTMDLAGSWSQFQSTIDSTENWLEPTSSSTTKDATKDTTKEVTESAQFYSSAASNHTERKLQVIHSSFVIVYLIPFSYRDFKCSMEWCNRTYRRKYELRRHMRTHHYGIKRWGCTFQGCNRAAPNGFGRKEHFKMHLQKIHPSAES